MTFRLRRFALLQLISFAGLASVSTWVGAEDATAEAKQGKVLAYTCHGCHGIDTYKNTYPTYSVPKLGGQHAKYIADALKEYASGDRAHGTMHAQASSLSEQDRAAIAAFFQGPEPRASATPIGTPPASTALCVTCHGNDGIGISPDYPILAGQHRDYLEQALRDYKSGKRKNPIMSGIVAQVKDEDIPSIANFFASQNSPLCATDEIRKHGKCTE
jgi:cytochrome c553